MPRFVYLIVCLGFACCAGENSIAENSPQSQADAISLSSRGNRVRSPRHGGLGLTDTPLPPPIIGSKVRAKESQCGMHTSLIPTLVAALCMSASVPGKSGTPPLPSNDPANWVKGKDFPPGHYLTGTTEFRLLVSKNGRVSECTITASSGTAKLDELTCQLVRKRARFSPAKDERGKRTVGTYSNCVRWVFR